MGVTWSDSPATTSPIDAANLNTLLQNDGSVLSTGAQRTSVTLSGTNKEVVRWTATDGNNYSLIIRTDGKIGVLDNTHAVYCLEISPSGGGITINGVAVPLTGAHSTSAFTLSAGAGAPAALAAGEIYFQLS